MLTPNTLLQNRYLVHKPLGKGGMGAVYLATDQRFGNHVALKETLVTGEQLRRAFEREARLLNGLNHTNLPHVIDYFSEGDGEFLVMQYIPGDDLGALLRARGEPFPIEQVQRWAAELLDLLDYLHSYDPPIIHRDIKPENLKLSPRGNLVLLDFGLAKGAVTAGMQETRGSVVGYTPCYASLEQIRGTGTDPRSDLYSLGATLYHLATARLPADALTRADAFVNGQPDPLRRADLVNPRIPPAFAAMLQTAMSLRQSERPASGSALREMLRDTAPQQGPPVAPPVRQDTIPVTREARAEASVPFPPARPTVPDRHATIPATQQPVTQSSSNTGWKILVALGSVLILVLVAVIAVLAYLAIVGPRPEPTPSEPYIADRNASPAVDPPGPYSPEPAPGNTNTEPPGPYPGSEYPAPATETRISAAASSTRAPINEITYTPDLALDGRSDTAWIEGAAGEGIGETITIRLSAPASVARLRIQPGYFKNPAIWEKNNRLARATLTLSDGRTIGADFEDAMREKSIVVGGGSISWIRLRIDDVYLGGDYLDTCISEIVVELGGAP